MTNEIIVTQYARRNEIRIEAQDFKDMKTLLWWFNMYHSTAQLIDHPENDEIFALSKERGYFVYGASELTFGYPETDWWKKRENPDAERLVKGYRLAIGRDATDVLKKLSGYIQTTPEVRKISVDKSHDT